MREKVFTWVFPVDNIQKLLWKKEIADADFLHAFFLFCFVLFFFFSCTELELWCKHMVSARDLGRDMIEDREVEEKYRKIPKISPSKYKPPKVATQKTFR